MSDLLSQDEIDALLNGVSGNDTKSSNESLNIVDDIQKKPVVNTDTEKKFAGGYELELTEMEKDALGEIGNISMGSAATALNEIIGQKVDITTPKVSTLSWEELISDYPKPFVVTKVEYTEGLTGTNLLIMNTSDVKILTNLMMGEDPYNDREITELELSAMGEAMNQMVGSSCTSIATMINKKIDIAPPMADLVDFTDSEIENYHRLYGDGKIAKVAFRMVVGNLIDSEIMQLLPITFAKQMVKSLVGNIDIEPETIMTQQPAYKAPENYNQSLGNNEQIYQNTQHSQPVVSQERPVSQQQYIEPQRTYEPEPRREPKREPVNVQPVQFQSLDDSNYSNYKENIGLIMDVPLQVTVELGRATKMIREILEFGPGSIVELDKLAGEPVDILVNGKHIAKGEVVVIDENFGVRITDIVHPSKRI